MDRLLKRYRFNVLLAANAKDGLKLVEERHPDLILLDIILPGISGIEVCKKLKSESATSSIPVIFYTAIDIPKHLIDYASYGAVDYVQKTMPADVLIRQIRSVLKAK